MKKAGVLLLLILCSCASFSQTGIDSVLYKKLRGMFKEDQKWRIESAKLYNHEKSDYDEATVERNWAATDSLNLLEAKRIISRYGFPGYSIAGEGGSSSFWAIVQHCDNDVPFQQRVLLLMKREVGRKNASGQNYAYLKDRVLTNLGQKQLYGTQGIRNPKTKKWAPLPISDPARVEARRKAMGMISLKQYTAEINAAN
jgi:hypothetical protein